jgi:hypothetical protein
MKEILIAVFVALISIFMTGYSVHMIIGGLVSKSTEHLVIAVAIFLLAILLAFMAKDLGKRKKGD